MDASLQSHRGNVFRSGVYRPLDSWVFGSLRRTARRQTRARPPHTGGVANAPRSLRIPAREPAPGPVIGPAPPAEGGQRHDDERPPVGWVVLGGAGCMRETPTALVALLTGSERFSPLWKDSRMADKPSKLHERSPLISEGYAKELLPKRSTEIRTADKDRYGFGRNGTYLAYVLAHEGMLPVEVADGVTRRKTVKGKRVTQLYCTTRRNTLGVPAGRMIWADSRLVQRPAQTRVRGAAERRRANKRKRLQLSDQHTTPGTPLVQGSDRTDRTTAPTTAQAVTVKCSEGCGTEVKAYGTSGSATCPDCKSE